MKRKTTKPEKAILQLNLHREHFAAIAAKVKRIEYRERTPYWEKRPEGRHYNMVHLRNGYATLAPEMDVEFREVKKIIKWGEPYYAIQLGRILRIKRWQR